MPTMKFFSNHQHHSLHHNNHLFLVLPLVLNTILLLLVQIFPSPVSSKRLRALGEPCGEEEPPLMKCAPGLECAPKENHGGGKRRCRTAAATTFGDNGDDVADGINAIEDGENGGDDDLATTTTTDGNSLSASELCLRAKCPVLFPDCPSDSVPVLSTGPVTVDSDKCCPLALVQCRCDPQKCLVPQCPDGSKQMLTARGTTRPGQCCDQFDCRQSDLNCEDVHCPDDPFSVLLDLYSPDGYICPDDSYRPNPYIPAGSCCPIVPQCQCRLGICKPAQCSKNEKLIIEEHGQGKPGKCCDKYKCVPTDGSEQNQRGNAGCKHKGQIYAVGQRWHTDLCQECQCSATAVSLCQRMECSELAPGCQWTGMSPGECCSVCLGCRDESGRTYVPGEHWEKDGCTNCTCDADFRWRCQKFICQTNCENPRHIAGQCCPVCDQPTISMEPPATCAAHQNCTLRCEFGLVQDQWTGCFECKCANGTNFIANEQQQTLNATICTPLTIENCPRLCAHGYLHDERTGCAQCRCAHCPPMLNCGKTCVHGWEINDFGCPICKCLPLDSELETDGLDDEKIFEKTSSTAELQITTPPFLHVQNSSPFRCTSGESERDFGEWWTAGCRQCFCQQGKEFCSLLACPTRPVNCPEDHWLRSADDCCPQCAHSFVGTIPFLPGHFSNKSMEPNSGQQVCYSPGTGQLFVDGQTWHLGEDHCLGCTCRMGHVLCVWNDGHQCPPTPCEHPVMDMTLDKCCPRCPPAATDEMPIPMDDNHLQLCHDNFTGTVYSTLAEWRRDECQSCHCNTSGQIVCFRERCVSNCGSGRFLSLKGRCCPICSDSMVNSSICQYDGRTYEQGEHFQDGPCRNCTCLPGGLLKCLEIHCPSCTVGTHYEGENLLEMDTGNKSHEVRNCCPVCKSENEGLPPYSSFERGTEQTVFIEATRQNEFKKYFEKNIITDNNNNNNDLFWLLSGCFILICFALCLCTIATKFLLIRWRKQRTKCTERTGERTVGKNTNVSRDNTIRWHMTFPDRSAERRSYTKNLKQDAVAGMSLLRMKESTTEHNY